MQAAVDVDDGLAFAGQRLRRFVIQPAAQSQPLGNRLVLVDLRQILGRRNQRDLPIHATRGLAYRNHLDPVRARGQTMEVFARFVVVGEVEVLARLVAEHGFRRGNGLRRNGRQSRSEESELCQHSSDGSRKIRQM